MTSPARRLAHVIGLGLIGSSVALALAATGWRVTGEDLDPEATSAALEADVISDTSMTDDHVLLVVATPAGAVASVARDYLARFTSASLIATDVAGVKSSIVSGVSDARFLGGHPMAGSEQRGLQGARLDLFSGCTWVLTPTPLTSPATYSTLHGYLRDIGASVVALDANDHDRLVALASHVPHLLAGALMNEATKTAEPSTRRSRRWRDDSTPFDGPSRRTGARSSRTACRRRPWPGDSCPDARSARRIWRTCA